MAARGRVGSPTCRTARGPWPETRCAPGGTPGKAHGGPAPMPAGGAEPVSGLPAGPSPPPPLRPRLPESRAHGQERRRHGDLLPEALRSAIAWAHRTAAIQRQAPRALAGCAGPVIRERVWLTGVLSLGLSALGKSHVKEYLCQLVVVPVIKGTCWYLEDLRTSIF